jgi:hypothetical protein
MKATAGASKPTQRRESHTRQVCQTRQPWCQCADRGSVSLVMVILAVVLFMAAGLVIDGGSALAARGRAASLAQQASRAGLGAIDPASLRGRSPADIVVDPNGAARAAQAVLVAGGAQGEVSVAGDTVTVTAHVRRRAVVLSAFGLTDLTGTATASATLVHGTTSGTPVGSTP